VQEAQTLPTPDMTEKKKTSSIWQKLRPAYPFLVILTIWQIAAMQAKGNLGQLFPTLDAIAYRGWELLMGPLMDAIQENPALGLFDYFYYFFQSPILWHTFHTAWRLPFAFLLGAIFGVIIGVLMGRFALWESFCYPLIAVLLPIPALAWVPMAVIWFGLGNQTVIIITGFATFLPITMAVWTGVKTVNPVWIRAAQSMNANKMTIFRTVVIPGSLPMIMSGFRIGMARAWRAGVGAEAFSGIKWGLSAGIFDAQEFLDIAFMMVALSILGVFGFLLEKVLFQPVEKRTVIRWGMMEAMGEQNKKV